MPMKTPDSDSLAAMKLRPGDFPIGSTASRAAARLRLQKVGDTSIGSLECICFPEDERPFFRTWTARTLAASVLCPVHGVRVEEAYYVYVSSWRWESEVKLRWPRLSPQFHRAWGASGLRQEQSDDEG